MPARGTIDIKIRMFQYKILNNILFLNQRLYCMKKIDSPLCSLCKREVETVSHLFLKCEQSKNLWLSTQKWCNSTLKLPHLSEKVIHLGWLSEQPKWILVNRIILLYKYFIYLKRDDTTRLNFHAFKSFLGYILRTEESIAKNRNRLTLHYEKWEPISHLLS